MLLGGEQGFLNAMVPRNHGRVHGPHSGVRRGDRPPFTTEPLLPLLMPSLKTRTPIPFGGRLSLGQVAECVRVISSGCLHPVELRLNQFHIDRLVRQKPQLRSHSGEPVPPEQSRVLSESVRGDGNCLLLIDIQERQ